MKTVSLERILKSKGFTLVELLVVIAIIALLVSILLPSLASARFTAKQQLNQANLNQFSTATHSYASEFKDRIWAFTSAPQTTFGDLRPVATDEVASAARQAVDIIRRRAPNYQDFPLPTAWIPHILYSHLVLLDYLAARMPEPMVISPLDRVRSDWQQRALPDPHPLGAELTTLLTSPRWMYSSSYTPSIATFTPDKESNAGGYVRSIDWGQFQSVTGTGSGYPLGNRKISDIAFPGQKVHMYEYIQRTPNNKKDAPFVYPFAKITVNTFAGQVQVIDMQKANPGGFTRPNANTNSASGVIRATISYVPNLNAGDPLWPGRAGQDQGVYTYFRHTVGGLKGIDFGGTEVFLGPPAPLP